MEEQSVNEPNLIPWTNNNASFSSYLSLLNSNASIQLFFINKTPVPIPDFVVSLLSQQFPGNLSFSNANVGVPKTTPNSNKPIHRRCMFRADDFAAAITNGYPSLQDNEHRVGN